MKNGTTRGSNTVAALDDTSGAIDSGKVVENQIAPADWVEIQEQSNSRGCDGVSLTLYLRQVREVPTLSRAQEIEWAKKREMGESVKLNHLLSNRLALDHVLRLGAKVLGNELAVEQVQ